MHACTTKSCSLKLVTKQYCEGITKNTGINCVWIIDNAVEVLQKFNRLKGAKHFDSFDFSTLYMNIPHDLLLDSILLVKRIELGEQNTL